jgi:hypothetical protein
MQQILNVLVKADTYDLVTLEGMKAMLLIPPTDTSKDILLTELITVVSETVAKMCNRVFSYEKVREQFYQLEDGNSSRLYLSRWPVKFADIESINRDDDDYDLLPDNPTRWLLEEETGMLYSYPASGYWYGTVDVIYSGGYVLPDEAPGPLKFAVAGVIRESYMAWIRNPALFGVRQLGHKEARIAYYDPTKLGVALGSPETWQAVQSVLDARYTRFWV